jgi:hypothetical protein
MSTDDLGAVSVLIDLRDDLPLLLNPDFSGIFTPDLLSK